MFVITAALLATLAQPSLTAPDAGVSDGGQASRSVPAFQSTQGNQRGGRPNRAADTDETVAVTKGTRLSVNNFAGEVQIRTWDRDSVRVQAFHSRRSTVSVKPGSSALVVTSSGMSGAIDYDISVPAWMPVKIEGTYL
jgi:hypothetical protein